jgi:hypothetical protein
VFLLWTSTDELWMSSGEHGWIVVLKTWDVSDWMTFGTFAKNWLLGISAVLEWDYKAPRQIKNRSGTHKCQKGMGVAERVPPGRSKRGRSPFQMNA